MKMSWAASGLGDLTGAAAVSRKRENHGDGEFWSSCFHRMILKKKKRRIVLYKHTG